MGDLDNVHKATFMPMKIVLFLELHVSTFLFDLVSYALALRV